MSHAALVLFAHGSRKPEWSGPMLRLRDSLRERHGGAVVLAFAELQPPTLVDAVRGLVERGCADVVVVPVFFGPGRHVREDLPAAITQVHSLFPGVRVRATGAIGDEPVVLAGLADGIAAAARRALDDENPRED